jgi:WD40 repeat protein
LGRLPYDALRAHEGPVYDAAFSADGRWAVTAGADFTARLWDLRQAYRRKPQSLRQHTQTVRHVAITPDSTHLVTAGDDGKLFRWTLTENDPLTTAVEMPGHEAEVSAMALSADGSLLVSASVDGTVRLHAMKDGGSVRLNDHAGPVRDVGVDDKGTRVLTAGADATGMLYSVSGGRASRRVRLEGHEGELRAACVSPDGSWAITGSDDGTARLWEASRRAPGLTVRVLAGHEGAVTQAVVTHDSKLAITGGEDGKLFVWNLEAKQPELGATTFDLHDSEITDLRTIGPGADPEHPQPRYLLSASTDGTARTWNLETRERAQQSVQFDVGSPVRAVAASEDGRYVLTGGDEGLVRLWDPREKGAAGACRVARSTAQAVLGLAVNAVGTRLAAAGDDGRVMLWDSITLGPVRSVAALAGHKGRVRAVAFSPNSEFIATGGDDGIVRLWKATAADPGAGHLDLKGHSKVVNGLIFAPDGKHLISISADRTARVWKMASRDPSKAVTVLPHRDEVNSMALSADGRWLLTGTISRLRLWDLEAKDVAKAGKGLKHPHDKDIDVVAIGPKGNFGLSASVDATTVLWRLDKGKSERLRQHDQPVKAAAFSPDGRWLATGSEDTTIRLYDLRKAHPEEESQELTGHGKTVAVLRFSADSEVLVSGSNDATVRIWHLATGDGKAISASASLLEGHDGLVSDLRLAQDGRFIASGSYDGSARLWPMFPEELAEVGCRRVGRDLTPEEWKRWLPDRRYRAICDPG